MRILLVEDDRKGAYILRKGLEEEGFTVDHVENDQQAEEALAARPYALVILDWMLPGKQGIEICRELRQRDASLPILILTAKDALSDRVAGLNMGADDYLTKPYAFWELLARVRALLRRSKHARPPVIRIADVTIDPVTHDVTRAGQPIDLTRKEYAILNALAQVPGQIVTRPELARIVGQDDAESASNLVDVYVSHLRKKLEVGSGTVLIRTVRGRGFSIGGAST
ncbi:MAG: response regulator transcription factor [Acidobacteriota bacterium]